jgi:beta-galactosidase
MGFRQPGLGLDELFGARESYVEFTPDLLADLKLAVAGARARGGVFLQAYEPTTGRVVGTYDDGRAAAVDNAYGAGRTRLVGTMCGYGYGKHPDDRSPQLFADALAFAGKQQHVRSSEPRVKARLHAGTGGTYLWVANPARKPLPVRLELGGAWGPFKKSAGLWGAEAKVDGRSVALTAGARDVAVIALE